MEEDIDLLLKQSTWLTKENIIQKDSSVSWKAKSIRNYTKDVMDWHNQMRKTENEDRKTLSPTYLKTIHGQLATFSIM